MAAPAEAEPALVGLDDIRAAAARIGDAVERTAYDPARTLSALTGAELWLKFENLQFTASFKERGALNRLLALTQAERARGVIAMSAGNHAQGVAYHAGRLGIPATIVMPEGTPFVKVKHTRDFGARVIVEGATLADADARARTIAASENLVFVHPFDDPLVIAGQGTVALEILEQGPVPDVLVVPIGGGGLISGIAAAAKALHPGISVVGVQSALYPGMHNAVKGTQLPCGGASIAEGIAVKFPGRITQAHIRALVDDIVLVGEEDIEHAIGLLLSVEKTVAEGAGAAGLAAVLAHPAQFRGRRAGLVLCGGNIDMRLLSNVILRELSREGRIVTLAVAIEDRPGFLGQIAGLIARAGGNILDVSHNRLITTLPAKSADLSITIEARDQPHAAEIVSEIEGAGFSVRVLTPIRTAGR